MSTSTRSEARWFQKLPSLKYYNVLKWERRFNSMLLKLQIISKNAPNKSCLVLNFAQKSQSVGESSKYYNVLKWEGRFTLRLNTAKNTHYIK